MIRNNTVYFGKKFKSFISSLLVVSIVLCGMFAPGMQVSVNAVTQAEIDALEEQRDEIRAKMADLKEQLDALESEMSSVIAKKAALDEQNELNARDIELINKQIELYDRLIDEKNQEVIDAQKTADSQYSRFVERFRSMEENGKWSYISILFKATSFSDLLSRLDYIIEIMQYDKKVEEQYIESKELLEQVRGEYQVVLEQQEAKKAELEQTKQTLEQQIEDAYTMIAELENDISAYTEAYDENEQLESEVQADIDAKVQELEKQKAAEEAARQEAARKAALEKQKQQQATANANAGVGTVSTGYYSWPCPSCTYITSQFGYRIHPIFKTTKYHSGVDIGASAGATIVAAAAGTVLTAQYSDSYGNYVVVYHSNGTTTLYAHMSSMAVSAGQTVSQGATLGYVGSTGWSTGPHLHYEIRINGSCVNPLSYYNLSFSFSSSS